MKRFWPVLLILLGLGILFSGFCYDVMFAGIPFQDPTPELAAQYAYHARMAATIRGAGLAIFLLGVLAGFVVWLRGRLKK